MEAVRMVKYRKWSMRKVARRYGVEPSTISRWCKNPLGTGWNLIPTESARPKKSPGALDAAVVEAIIKKRLGRRRCAAVIYQELVREGVQVSLSSVKRTLDRCGLTKKRSPWKRPHDYTERPEPAFPGALVEVDTIQIRLPDAQKLWIYTLIDVKTRWVYAEVVHRIGAHASATFIRHAVRAAPFRLCLIQTDHGSEFSTRFTHRLLGMHIVHRHARVRQKNDQAHIERFNRTVQEECFDQVPHSFSHFVRALKAYLPYYNSERLHMGLNYQTPQEVLRRS
jgi:transposase InsO family protein